MANPDLIKIFTDTRLQYTKHPTLLAACAASREKQFFYREGIFNHGESSFDFDKNRFEDETSVIVSNKRSFEAAEQYAKKGMKTCVLNFANFQHAGGGVFHGSGAQEESLCRTSTLFDAIGTPEMHKVFYDPHIELDDTEANDDAIYTPGVVVFKTDEYKPKMRPENEWFSVDVITCAAPCLGWGCGEISDKKLFALHESRARQILSIAAKNGAESLILGAFGCGAFQNPPEIVASAYKKVLPEFSHAFRIVEFAVFYIQNEIRNFEAFRAAFGIK